MIIKSYGINKIQLDKFKFYLLYGKNEGAQADFVTRNFVGNFSGEVIKYDEQEFINNNEVISSEILTKSLFETNKILIISRVTDKSYKFIEDIIEKDPDDIKIILKSGLLEKKSKIRNLFEKNNNLVTLPFYDDNNKSLTTIIENFLNMNKLKLSRETINLLIERCSGDRVNLKIELEKIYNFSLSNKNITYEIVKKLSNLAENYSVNEIAESFLLKNKKNISKMLNENNYTNEDCVLILRTILNKSKRLLNIIEENNKTKNIDKVISSYRPPIFWKEKNGLKLQANAWKIDDLKRKIFKINDLEALIKNNSKNSLNLLSDFIIT